MRLPDVLKSRLQNAKGGEGLMAVIKNGLKNEGPTFLMRGWTPAWLRLAPNTVLTFVFMEQIMRGVTWYREKDSMPVVQSAKGKI